MATLNSALKDRVTFEKTKSDVVFPYLLDVQIEAFQSFIQNNIPEDERLNVAWKKFLIMSSLLKIRIKTMFLNIKVIF